MASRSEFDDLLANGITPYVTLWGMPTCDTATTSTTTRIASSSSIDRYCLPIYITHNSTTAQGEHGWRPDDVLEDQFWVDFSNAYLTEAAKAPQGSRRSTSYFG
ncbi:hypothetical protein CGRA01v4_07766 [Colletotrichum graminicola]|nr:hypothetical protein CGRA01v4_07766 [Colletotrichum graminicola]